MLLIIKPPPHEVQAAALCNGDVLCLSGDLCVDIPECGTCQCPLTVKHILVECVDLNDVRNKNFVASSIKDIFDNVEAQKIVDFIKDTRFYKQL